MDFFIRKPHILNGTEKCQMIIDMQTSFLPSENKVNFEEYAIARRRLVANIISRIEKAKDEKQDLVVIEFAYTLWKLPEIKKAIGKYPHLSINKRQDGLLSYWDRSADVSFESLKPLMDSDVQISGINGSGCIKASAYWLKERGFKVSVMTDSILNAKNTSRNWILDFRENNRIGTLRKHYEENYIPIMGLMGKRESIVHMLKGTEGIDGNKYIWEL